MNFTSTNNQMEVEKFFKLENIILYYTNSKGGEKGI